MIIHHHRATMLYPPWRLFAAELVGTFLLTFFAAGPSVIDALSAGAVSRGAVVVAPALIVLAMIFAIGSISGAHINPVVTLAFALRHDFPWSGVALYWSAQILGASLAGGCLRLMFGNVGRLGATWPQFGVLPALVTETILTATLVFVILATSFAHKPTAKSAPFAVGAVIAAAGLCASPVSGASMNPARSFGPALANGNLEHLWIYFAGPLLGAVCAVLLANVLLGPRSKYETEAAQ